MVAEHDESAFVRFLFERGNRVRHRVHRHELAAGDARDGMFFRLPHIDQKQHFTRVKTPFDFLRRNFKGQIRHVQYFTAFNRFFLFFFVFYRKSNAGDPSRPPARQMAASDNRPPISLSSGPALHREARHRLLRGCCSSAPAE
jgi:hypothetical protein